MKITFPRPLYLVLLLFITFGFSLRLSAQYPSDSVQVSLLTLSPGSETYASFGHSALRVSDPVRGSDYVYNYGTFDFSTSNFYVKFGFGRLMYFLSINDYRDFYMAYKMWGQAMWEQKLNLTNKEKWQLIQNLHWNYKIENRFYRYGFFRDNCSTRIRDIIEKSVDGKVVYDSTYIKKPESFRQLFAGYLQKEPWSLFGINILLGKGTDSIAGVRDYMFLPENMMHLFATAKISGNGAMRNLSGSPVLLYPTTLSFSNPGLFTLPEFVFWVLFIIVLIFSYLGFKRKKHFRWFDIALFLITGLLGLLVFVLMLFSLHPELWTNSNVIWANPLNLIFAVGLIFSAVPRWLRILLMVYGLFLLIFIPLSLFLTQVLPGAAYPLMGILLIRTMKIIYGPK